MEYIRFFSLQIILFTFLGGYNCRAGTIAAGYGFTVFTDENGTLWSVGKNDYGQLGIGKTSNYESKPSRTGWKEVDDIITIGDTTFIKSDKLKYKAMSGENIFRYDLFSFVESNQNRDFFYDTFFKERRIDESMFNSGYWGKLGRSYFTSYSMPFRSSMTEFSTELSYHWVWDKEQYDHHLDDPLSKYELSEVYKLNFEIYSYKGDSIVQGVYRGSASNVIFHASTNRSTNEKHNVIYQDTNKSIWSFSINDEYSIEDDNYTLIINEESKIKKVEFYQPTWGLDVNSNDHFYFLSD